VLNSQKELFRTCFVRSHCICSNKLRYVPSQNILLLERKLWHLVRYRAVLDDTLTTSLCWYEYLTRQAMYLQRDIYARPRNHCCRGKAVSVTYFSLCECVRGCVWVRACACVYEDGCTGSGVCFHACSLNNPTRIASPHCHLRPLLFRHIFRHYLMSGTNFGKNVTEHKICTRWFKYDRDKLWLVYTQIVPVIFEPPCILIFSATFFEAFLILRKTQRHCHKYE
jgi:hypothetical protein